MHQRHAHTQKNDLKPHLRTCWVIPPEHDAAFVACMEDVIEHLLEELSDMSKSDRRELHSRLLVLIAHVLK